MLETHPAIAQRDPDLLQNTRDEGVELPRSVDGELVQEEDGAEAAHLLPRVYKSALHIARTHHQSSGLPARPPC